MLPERRNTYILSCLKVVLFWSQIEHTNIYISKIMLLLLCTFSKIHRLQLHVHWYTKVFGNVKKSLYNQPKPYFFKRLLWSHFWIDFNKCYTKTFGIVYILFVYLLINYVYMSGFYLYIIFPWFLIFRIYFQLKYIGKSVNFYLLCLNYVQIKITHNNIMSK